MKPDWKDAPPWAKYLAMDANGSWYWYEDKPKPNAYQGEWVVEEKAEHLPRYELSTTPWWEQSLEEKPE